MWNPRKVGSEIEVEWWLPEAGENERKGGMGKVINGY
jgi:hypothetical protein